MGAWKYQIYFSNIIAHSFAALTREISCSTLEIGISAHSCIILYCKALAALRSNKGTFRETYDESR